jgi:8-oxo-dGTP pyrophosphatase MutT (NUDIX family)
MTESPWRIVRSRVAHENKWFRVRTDDVIGPDSEPGEFNVVELPPAVTVVALDSDDRFCLIREYRYSHRSWLWETPVGSIDPGDEDSLTAAQRELREETGLCSDDWTYLGATRGLKGVSNQILHTFLARNVTAGAAAAESFEVIDGLRFVSFGAFFAEVRRGDVVDGETIAAVTLAFAYLSQI